VSGGERGDAGFTRFADQAELQATGPVLRQQPPLVHSRMAGLGGRWESGTLYGYLRADYLTLWNKDTGYDISALCTATLGVPGLGALIPLLFNGHANDPERSATLLAAPVVWQDGQARFNPDPSAYLARYQFTTAHENFYATAESRLYQVNPPAPPGDHASLGLYLAKSKHGTYAFNPDGHEVIITLAQVSFVAIASIATIAITIDDIFANRPVSFRHAVLLSVVLIVTVIVEDCFTESFTEQGGAVPTDPLNVGEPSQALPGFAFAAGNEVRAKLEGAPKRAPRGIRDCHYRWLATKVFEVGEHYRGCGGTLFMQHDGNLVIYDEFDRAVWATGTHHWPGSRAVFQDDGNLVVYTSWGQAVWASNTAGRAAGGRLEFQGDGNFVIYSQAGPAVWSSRGGLVPPPPPPPPPPRDRCPLAALLPPC
jgi:hypothetical protein